MTKASCAIIVLAASGLASAGPFTSPAQGPFKDLADACKHARIEDACKPSHEVAGKGPITRAMLVSNPDDASALELAFVTHAGWFLVHVVEDSAPDPSVEALDLDGTGRVQLKVVSTYVVELGSRDHARCAETALVCGAGATPWCTAPLALGDGDCQAHEEDDKTPPDWDYRVALAVSTHALKLARISGDVPKDVKRQLGTHALP